MGCTCWIFIIIFFLFTILLLPRLIFSSTIMLIDFLLLPMNVWNHPMNVWNHKEIWAVIFGECCFRLCVYVVHWSEFCGGTCIWCGIHIRDIRCQKLGLVWRGNQTFEQFLFSIYIYIYIYMYNKFFVVEDSLTVRGIAFVFFIGDYLECALVR